MAVEVVLEMLFMFPVKPGQPFSELEANMLSMVGRGVLVTGEGLPQSWVQVSWGKTEGIPGPVGSAACRQSHLLLIVCLSQNVCDMFKSWGKLLCRQLKTSQYKISQTDLLIVCLLSHPYLKENSVLHCVSTSISL